MKRAATVAGTAEQMIPVSPILLNTLEERLHAVMQAISGTAEALGAMKDMSHMEFVADALFDALSEKMGHCFYVLSEGRLLKSDREPVEVDQ